MFVGLFIEMSFDGIECPLECVINLRRHPLKIDACERNVLKEFRVHSSIH